MYIVPLLIKVSRYALLSSSPSYRIHYSSRRRPGHPQLRYQARNGNSEIVVTTDTTNVVDSKRNGTELGEEGMSLIQNTATQVI